MSVLSVNAKQFCEYVEKRYKGRLIRLERSPSVDTDELVVRLEFRIPACDADELEMFRRINRVIEVVVEDAA